jgi:hypothetical protein
VNLYAVPGSLVTGDDPRPVGWTVELSDQWPQDGECLCAFRGRYSVSGKGRVELDSCRGGYGGQNQQC